MSPIQNVQPVALGQTDIDPEALARNRKCRGGHINNTVPDQNHIPRLNGYMSQCLYVSICLSFYSYTIILTLAGQQGHTTPLFSRIMVHVLELVLVKGKPSSTNFRVASNVSFKLGAYSDYDKTLAGIQNEFGHGVYAMEDAAPWAITCAGACKVPIYYPRCIIPLLEVIAIASWWVTEAVRLLVELELPPADTCWWCLKPRPHTMYHANVCSLASISAIYSSRYHQETSC